MGEQPQAARPRAQRASIGLSTGGQCQASTDAGQPRGGTQDRYRAGPGRRTRGRRRVHGPAPEKRRGRRPHAGANGGRRRGRSRWRAPQHRHRGRVRLGARARVRRGGAGAPPATGREATDLRQLVGGKRRRRGQQPRRRRARFLKPLPEGRAIPRAETPRQAVAAPPDPPRRRSVWTTRPGAPHAKPPAARPRFPTAPVAARSPGIAAAPAGRKDLPEAQVQKSSAAPTRGAMTTAAQS